MPRDANGVYSLPPAYLAITGDTITALQHNSPLEDVRDALTNSIARDGRTVVTGNIPFNANRITNLGDPVDPTDAANKRHVETVANGKVAKIGDTMTGTLGINTSAPTIALQDTDGRSGFVHVNNNVFHVLRGAVNGTIWDNGPNNRQPMTINLDTGNMTLSGSWTSYGASTSYGNLTINAAWPAIVLQKTASNQSNNIIGYSPGGVSRWSISLGNQTNESGGDAGSDFSVDRYSDNGTWLGNPLTIARATGLVYFAARPTWAGATPWDSSNFTPGNYYTKTEINGWMAAKADLANPIFSGEINVGAARYVSDGNIYGAVWGNDWLSNHLTNRFNTKANANGQWFSGNVAVSRSDPMFELYWGGIKHTQIWIDGGGSLVVRDGGSAQNHFLITSGGGIWSQQIGWLTDYVWSTANERGSAHAAAVGNDSFRDQRWTGGGDAGVAVNSWIGGGSGAVIKGVHGGNTAGSVDVVRIRYLQYYKPNTGWVTVGDV